MDFRLSPEQELLRDSARKLFVASADDRTWAQCAEMGLLAMPVPEVAGGLDSPLEDLSLVCEQIGQGLANVPFVGGAVLPARLLAACAAAPGTQAALSALAEGAQRFAVALYEPGRRYALVPEHCHVRCDDDGRWRLRGHKLLVAGGAEADQLIVSARLDTGALSLWRIDVDQAAVQRRSYRAVDGSLLADFVFDAAIIGDDAPLAVGDAATAAIEVALDSARVCLCAELLGSAERAIELAADYLRLRKQFGRALAEFQALQHAAAEMAIEADGARSILYRAIAMMPESPRVRRAAVSACMLKLLPAVRQIAATAVHLHGGIGFTEEYPVGRVLQRVLLAERLFGDHEHHLARYQQP